MISVINPLIQRALCILWLGLAVAIDFRLAAIPLEHGDAIAQLCIKVAFRRHPHKLYTYGRIVQHVIQG
jgi:hypothetical protein